MMTFFFQTSHCAFHVVLVTEFVCLLKTNASKLVRVVTKFDKVRWQ